MLIFGIVIGFVFGFIFACLCMGRLIIGTLKTTHDDYDGSTYPYIELDRPLGAQLHERKFVILKVDHSQQ